MYGYDGSQTVNGTMPIPAKGAAVDQVSFAGVHAMADQVLAAAFEVASAWTGFKHGQESPSGPPAQSQQGDRFATVYGELASAVDILQSLAKEIRSRA